MEKTSYKDLKVWQRAIDLVPMIYQMTSSLPKHETYALGDQLRRAAVSIPANIAEGQARQHPKEFVQHLTIAKGSLAEVHTLLIVAQRLNYLEPARFAELEAMTTEVAKMLNGLIRSIRKR